jgi:hypothetical protein
MEVLCQFPSSTASNSWERAPSVNWTGRLVSLHVTETRRMPACSRNQMPVITLVDSQSAALHQLCVCANTATPMHTFKFQNYLVVILQGLNLGN